MIRTIGAVLVVAGGLGAVLAGYFAHAALRIGTYQLMFSR
jgi:hypothetical protein